MKRAILFLMLTALPFLLALPAAAQAPQGSLSIGYQVKVKMDSVPQFETALKQHVAWLKQQNETWTWEVWEEVSGPDLATYVIRSGNHTLQDLDAHAAFAKANREHWLANVAQFTRGISVGMSLYRSDISRPPAGNAAPALAMVYGEHLKPGSEEKFDYVAGKVNAAIKKTNWPVHYFWLQGINGQPGPLMVRVAPRSNWAGFKPPSKSFRAMLEEAYGRQEADSLLRMAAKTVESETSAAFMYRPDLSYKPAQ